MDGLAEHPSEALDAAGEGTPYLTLDGYSGPLDHLLTLARAQRIEIGRISLAALVDQLAIALQQAPAAMSLGQKGDWVVMAAWLVQLRTRFLLPADALMQKDAATEAGQLRARLGTLAHIQTLAGWLERRPQFGQDAFARGRPEVLRVSVEAGFTIDVIEFLWASMALFDDGGEQDTATVYRPVQLNLYTVADARDRILRLLGQTPDGMALDRLLPDASDQADVEPRRDLRRRSAWSSTFIASLELARQGDVVLGQGGDFEAIHVAPT